MMKVTELKDITRCIEKYNCHPNVQGINLVLSFSIYELGCPSVPILTCMYVYIVADS